MLRLPRSLSVLILALVVCAGCKDTHHSAGLAATDVAKARAATIAARVGIELKREIPGVEIQSKDEGLSLTKGEQRLEVSLDNILLSCASSAAECDSTIAAAVQIAKKALGGTTDEDKPLDKALIQLTLKPDEWLAAADKDMRASQPEKFDDNRLVRTPFVADLEWVYVSDEPDGLRMIRQEQLAQLGLTTEQLRALALENLARQFPTLSLGEIAPGVWTIEPGDYHDAGRMALTEQWRAEAKKRGALIASVPARARVFVSNAPKERAPFDQITTMAFQREDHPISTAVLEWTEQGWKAAGK